MAHWESTNDLLKRHHDLWSKSAFPRISFDAAGLVALADLTTVARRTSLTGTSALLDALVICPGLHRQQSAPELNLGEFPACAALTSGYVFRVENQATVHFLQKVGKTGYLTTLKVRASASTQSFFWRALDMFYPFSNSSFLSTVAYMTAVCLTVAAFTTFSLAADFWGLGVLCVLIFARGCNIFIIRRRVKLGWKGQKEPGVKGDLLVLLSNDRWIRMQGLTDDLKVITSGEWLCEASFFERCITALATVLVYLNAALSSNVTNWGKVVLVVDLMASAGLLAISNEATTAHSMHGRILSLSGEPKKYTRRLHLADELIKETGRDDWAIRLGMINPQDAVKAAEKYGAGVTM